MEDSVAYTRSPYVYLILIALAILTRLAVHRVRTRTSRKHGPSNPNRH